MKIYQCTNCKSQIDGDQYGIDDNCPYCETTITIETPTATFNEDDEE